MYDSKGHYSFCFMFPFNQKITPDMPPSMTIRKILLGSRQRQQTALPACRPHFFLLWDTIMHTLVANPHPGKGAGGRGGGGCGDNHHPCSGRYLQSSFFAPIPVAHGLLEGGGVGSLPEQQFKLAWTSAKVMPIFNR